MGMVHQTVYIQRMDAPVLPPSVPPLDRRRIWMARGLAMAVDFVQIVLFPLFGEGFASPVNVALDVITGVVLVRLLGFHWAFLPTFAAEALPVADLVPTWTGAVFLVTGLQSRPGLKKALVLLGCLAVALCAFGLWWLFRQPGT
jgi:hypothetical protein